MLCKSNLTTHNHRNTTKKVNTNTHNNGIIESDYILSNIRFVHAADLHLDSPFSGMRSEATDQIADALHKATFDAYNNIIKLCLEEKVDALLVAGDIYDGADRSLKAQLEFVKGLKKIEQAGIRSFICHGNHDPLDGWEAKLDLPRGCTRFGPNLEGAPIFADNPERAMVYGISYPKRDVKDNLTTHFKKAESEFNIGLLHANVGNNTKHGSYSPCTIDDLISTNIDYWALGHVHTRQILREKNPAIVYPGNTQGRNSKEQDAHGVYLVDVNNEGNPNLDFKEMNEIRWKTISIDIGNLNEIQDLINAISNQVDSALKSSQGRCVVLRITLTGRGYLHHTLKKEGTDVIKDEINNNYTNSTTWAWCESISPNTASSIDRNAIAEQDDFTGYLARITLDIQTNPVELDDIEKTLQTLYYKSQYLKKHIPSGNTLKELLLAAENDCLSELTEEDDDNT